MHKYLITISLLLISLVFILISGCEPYSAHKGLIAKVNGEPIYLRTLQTLQDMQTHGLGAKQRTSVHTLKKEYELTLYTLITNMLVMQELKKIGLKLSAEDYADAVTRISSSYPDGKFENIFADENIDIDIWKNLLFQQLSVEKFQNEIIAPQIIVPEADIIIYYEKNIQYFNLPERYTLIQHISANKKVLAKTLNNMNKDTSEIDKDIRIFTLTIRKKSIPEQWEKDILALKLGKNTPIRFRDSYYQFFTLLEIIHAKKLTLYEILPIIHKKLATEKIEENFKIWLEKAVKKSDIQISKHLIAGVEANGLKNVNEQLLE